MLKHKAIEFIGLVGIALAAHQAMASDIPTLGVNLCTLHYSKLAYGKTEESLIRSAHAKTSFG